ncbi:hypothetical protein EZS27_027354, partial [termite gut metagenome]
NLVESENNFFNASLKVIARFQQGIIIIIIFSSRISHLLIEFTTGKED